MRPMVSDTQTTAPARWLPSVKIGATGFNLDTLIGLLLPLAAMTGYLYTLAPTALDGDAALFQYTPHVLGVTYPTGFPLYILIGKLWLLIFPFGDIAWRMNLFSALCSAVMLPVLFHGLRRMFALSLSNDSKSIARWSALTAVLLFATVPTFWRWSTVAKTYALNMLLLSATLYLLALALEHKDSPRTPRYLMGAALLLGLQISVHNTAVLLIPGLLLLMALNFRPYLFSGRWFPRLTGLLIAPGLFYLYIPLRAEWLIAHYGRDEAIQRGLLADFYTSGWSGWLAYYTASGFTGGVVSNWGNVPQQFQAVYVPLLTDNFALLGAMLGVVGMGAMLWRQPRLFAPLFVIYAVPIPFVLTYGRGEQAAFLLASFLIFAIFAGYALMLSPQRLLSLVIFAVLVATLIYPRVYYNLNWLEAKWYEQTNYHTWTDAIAHPLEPEAALLAHWGDLTTFWYLQHAEGQRPDLLGLYPPTEEKVVAYLENHETLYIAGPLQGWASGIEDRFELIPWGRLVRIAPKEADPAAILPALSQRVEATFNQQLQLIGAEYDPQAVSGFDYPVTLTWHTRADIPPETTVSVRLSRDDGIVAQLDDTLRSGWFVHETLPPGQHVLSYMPVPVPLGIESGTYRVQMVVYAHHSQPWSLADGGVVLDLGAVEVVPPPTDYQPAPDLYSGTGGYNFTHEITLTDYEYSVARVGQGKGFALRMLWQAHTQPPDNYTLRVELVDSTGQVVRQVDQPRPTSTWQPTQFIRDQIDLVLPASAPVGENALRVRLSWIRPDGSALGVRRWVIPWGDNVTLDALQVTEKAGRVFDLPTLAQPFDRNFDNKARFLGFNSPHFSEDDAQLDSETRQLQFDFYWQGLREMDQLYFVFLHVVDSDGNIVAQHDRAPGIRGKQPTTSWLPGEVVLDPITVNLPPDIAPGAYTIRLGLYRPPMGPRLITLDEAGQPGLDFIEVGAIYID